MALIFAEQTVDLIEIDLKNKLDECVALSPKATVPVLKISPGKLIDESLDIMKWAFEQNNNHQVIIKPFDDNLIKTNDGSFKKHLDFYKYAARFPEQSLATYQQQAGEFPQQLNELLKNQDFLTSSKISTVDIALFPFMRQFSFVDKKWFDQQPWPHLQRWLKFWLAHDIFIQAFAWGKK